jgi:hypothetical protein
MISRPPASAEPMASIDMGTVITVGDSCGCASAAQRRSPKNVMSIRRLM